MNLNYRCSSSKRRLILLRVIHVKAVRCWPTLIINIDFHPPTFTSDEVKVLRHRLQAETKHLLLFSSCWKVNLDAALGAAWPSSRSTSPLGTAWVSLLTNTSAPQTQRRRSLICTVEPKLSHKASVWPRPALRLWCRFILSCSFPVQSATSRSLICADTAISGTPTSTGSWEEPGLSSSATTYPTTTRTTTKQVRNATG